MKPYTRADRVSALMQEALSGIIHKSIKDPRLDTVGITRIKMTADLKRARIYFVVTGESVPREDAAAGFKKASGFIKHALAQELDLRYMPELQFLYDDSIDYGIHIDSVLKRLVKEHGTDHNETEEE